MAQVFVDDLEGLDLTPEDAHHLQRVLRARPGETVIAADGRGRFRTCTYRGGTAPLEADGPVRTCERPGPLVTVGFVATKGERPEWVVQKLTEVGVDRIAVLRSRRSVVRWDDDRAARAVERLQRVSREAAAQSRRPWLAEVVGVLSVAELAALTGAPDEVGHGGHGGLALAQPGGAPPTLARASVAVGPEGGWDHDELAGFPQVGLGELVLRAETAAVGAGLLLCALRAGVVGPAPTVSQGGRERRPRNGSLQSPR